MKTLLALSLMVLAIFALARPQSSPPISALEKEFMAEYKSTMKNPVGYKVAKCVGPPEAAKAEGVPACILEDMK